MAKKVEDRKVSLAYVELTDESKRNVAECLETGMLANGRFVREFEFRIAKFAGTQYAVAVCNGTMADTLMLRTVAHIYGWTTVSMPALTFAAQLSAALDAGMTPVFVDVTEGLQCDYSAADDFIFGTSILGVPSQTAGDILLDSCETFVRGFGSFSIAATCSFYATHAVGIGEGGAVVTNREDIADTCRSLRNHGQDDGGVLSKFCHPLRGYNAKMSNLAAAVGCGQITVVDQINQDRLLRAKWYDTELGGSWLSLIGSPHGYPVVCDTREARDEKLVELEAAGVEARRLFSVLAQDEPGFYAYWDGGACPSARRIADTWLYVPCHQGLTEDDVRYVSEVLLR